MRTMFRGLTIGLAIYALSFVAPYVYPGSLGAWISVVLTAVALVFTIVWLVLVWRGMRWGGAKRENRGTRRAKQHAKDEREKRARMR